VFVVDVKLDQNFVSDCSCLRFEYGESFCWASGRSDIVCVVVELREESGWERGCRLAL